MPPLGTNDPRRWAGRSPEEMRIGPFGGSRSEVSSHADIRAQRLGGRSPINGRGFPATKPIAAKLGERIYVRLMNEGVMMHPWHLHGTTMRVVARDGNPLGSVAFTRGLPFHSRAAA